MRRTVPYPLKFAFPALAKRAANAREERGYLSEDGPVSVPVVPLGETALVARASRGGRGAPTAAVEFRLVDGTLMRPVLDARGVPHAVDPRGPGFDAFGADYPSPPCVTWLAPGGMRPTAAHRRTDSPDVSLFSRVRDEGAREAARAAHVAFASGLRLVDGGLWRPTIGPAWTLHDDVPDRVGAGALPRRRFCLRASVPDLDYPDAWPRNPYGLARLPLAAFDPRLPRAEILDALRASVGDVLLDAEVGRGAMAPAAGDLEILDDVPSATAPLSPWLLGMSAWREAESSSDGWSSLGHAQRARYAEAVAWTVEYGAGRLALEEAVASADAFAAYAVDDASARSLFPRVAAAGYLAGRSLRPEVDAVDEEALGARM